MNIISELSGQYQITVYTKDGIKFRSKWFDNIVTDAGLNQIGIGNFLTHCYVGSGNSTPIPTQSSLDNQVGSSTTEIFSQSAGASPTPPYHGYRNVSFRFAIGSVTGNLSEVGIGWIDALFSRALIVDDFGLPTTITVLENEGLVVTYLIRNYVPIADNSFMAIIADEVRNCTMRVSNATSGSTTTGWGFEGTPVRVRTGVPSIIAYDGDLGTIFQQPSGAFAVCTSTGNADYINNSYERGFSASWTQNVANFTNGIKSFFLPSVGLGAYQFSVDPPIMKNISRMLTMSFKIQWSRR